MGGENHQTLDEAGRIRKKPVKDKFGGDQVAEHKEYFCISDFRGAMLLAHDFRPISAPV